MSKYAIPIEENTLDLIEFLNDGVRPKLEEEPTYFIFDIESPNEITTEIKIRDDLYEGKTGHTGTGYVIHIVE